MNKTISRRRFLKKTTVAAAGGAVLLETSGAHASAGNAAPPYQPSRAEIAQAYQRQDSYDDLVRLPVYKARIEPHWFAQNKRFWYRNDGARNIREFVVVDPSAGTRRPAFDHARLATAFGKAVGKTYRADALPFDTIVYTDDEKSIRFRAEGREWECNLTSYECTTLPAGTIPSAEPAPEGNGRRRPRPDNSFREREGVSPDGQWHAFVRDHNVWVKEEKGTTEKQLTLDGTAEQTYGGLRWSPDSKVLAGFRIHPVSIDPVYMVESSPKDGGMRGVLHKHEYAQPGDPFPAHAPYLFDPAAGKAIAVAVDPVEFGEEPPDIVWYADSSAFLYEKIDRGHQRFRIFRVDAHTGKPLVVVDEQTKTFINTSNSYNYYTKSGTEVVYVSEQEGWRHLYLYDTEQGKLKNRITQGEWVVRSIDRVDEEARQIWFQGSGRNAGENPYHLHFYRVNFDGTGLVALTDGNGTHSIQYSPDHAYLIDTYSRVDLPPVHTLRRVSDGKQVCELEKSDISALTTAGWRAPEIFKAKARDGSTDIWGVVFRPLNFDPKKRYPVIENIYAGPQDSFVRHSFAVRDGMQVLAELGFVVIQCDGLGTRNRSKAFHDVCWRNLKDAGLPDRILWIKALAARYPYVDAERVGIYGTSAGGQSSTGAVLFHPEFYKVAVSSCGCHDNRVDKRWWNEQWMGYPIGPWYDESSNVTHAANLRGKLLLMVGELDSNVPPESTIRVTDALMKADKDFDLIIITGSDHTSGGAYGERRRRDYFVRHLLGVEPPDRNAPKQAPVPTVMKARPLGEETMANSNGGADTVIVFRNQTKGEIKLYWLPGEGKRTAYGTVASGASREMHTYSGHYWLVTDKDDKPLALYIGESHPGIAEIR